jgi:antitoxin component YwqK of YwqJK toxin-antitoxin module
VKKHGWWVKTQKSNHPLIELDTIEKGWYSHLKRLEQETTFLNDKIYTGLFVKCNSDSVINVQLFEKGKFKKYLKIREVDSILNLQVKLSWQNLHDDDPSYPKNPSQIKPANISEDGIFKNGLFTGKKYIYDKNGLLDKIEVWKNGKYAGDAQID